MQALFLSAQHIYEKREGSGAGSVPLINGSRRPKNIRILRIRIPKTGSFLHLDHDGVGALVTLGREGGELGVQHVPRHLNQLVRRVVVLVVHAQHRPGDTTQVTRVPISVSDPYKFDTDPDTAF